MVVIERADGSPGHILNAENVNGTIWLYEVYSGQAAPVAGGIALISCCGIGGCIALIGMGAKGVAEKHEQVQKQAAETKKTPSDVAPSTLLADYKANEVAADGKYKGKWLKIQGPVNKIAKDIGDTIYVTFKSGERFDIMSVQCFFDDKFTAKAAQLSPGQAITVIGKCNGKFGNVLIKECEFVD